MGKDGAGGGGGAAGQSYGGYDGKYWINDQISLLALNSETFSMIGST